MKRIIWLLSLVFIIGSCKKEMPEPPTEETSNTSGWGNTSYNEYNVTFFTTYDSGNGPINVSFNGQNGTITYYFNYDPGCNAGGCANFTVSPGTYNYNAVAGSFSRFGTVTTGASQCITINL
jgi:hypothetical protein